MPTTNYQTGDVLKHRQEDRYLRVLAPPALHADKAYVTEVTDRGYRLSSRGEWRAITYLDRVYAIHYKADA